MPTIGSAWCCPTGASAGSTASRCFRSPSTSTTRTARRRRRRRGDLQEAHHRALRLPQLHAVHRQLDRPPPGVLGRAGGVLLMRIWLAILFALSLAACGRYAVRPDEKEYLADRIMQPD